MKNQKTETCGLEWAQLMLLIDMLKKDRQYKFLLLVSIGSYTGLRVSDILKLRWYDIYNKAEFSLSEKKTGKHRQIAINETLDEIIKLCFSKLFDNNKDYLKAFVLANRWGKPISLQFLNRKSHDLFKRYGIQTPNPSSHLFRKSFGRRIFEQNKKSDESLILLSEIFNHSNTKITRKYIGITQDQVRNTYLSL